MPRRTYLPLPLEAAGLPLARLLYRVRALGLENLPSTGGAVLIVNHLSYVDVIALHLACPRRIRFIAYEGPGLPGILSWAYRLTHVVPLALDNPLGGMRQAVKALRAGELVGIFPEGQISRTGQLMEIKKGFETIARHAGVPVVPVAIDGLWGSVFSFAGRRYVWKSPRLKPTPVCVAFGRPIPAEEATVDAARRAMLDLGAAAFDERPGLQRHVGREAVRELAKRPWRRVLVDCTATRRGVSAGQLLVVAGALSRRIRKAVPENRVGIVLPPGVGAFAANLAVVCAGKVPVNLNFTAGRAALEASLATGGIKTVISADAMRSRVGDFPWPERTLDIRAEMSAALGGRAVAAWLAAVWLLPNQWVANLFGLPRTGDREEAALLFTSGSAGAPKGVVLTHRNILANCAQFSSLSILPEGATLLACLPIFHSFGFTVTLWYPLLRDCGAVTVPSPLDTRKIVETIRDERVSVLLGAPTFIRPILKRARPADLVSLDLVVAGAEKLPDDLQQQFLKAFHLDILQGYGLTETSPAAAVNQPDPPATTSTATVQRGKRRGTVGRLLPGMTARIIDPDTGADLPLTATGIVCLRGANVFPGYLGEPASTEAAFRDGWFTTGDIGHFDADGFLTVEGRQSRFSKIGGEMVPQVSVERKIAEALSLDPADGAQIAVVGIPDDAKGEALVLVAASSVDLSRLREALAAAGLPNLWIPRIIRRVDKIPLLGTGKLDLKSCREIALKGP